jgi:hypothetical protein
MHHDTVRKQLVGTPRREYVRVPAALNNALRVIRAHAPVPTPIAKRFPEHMPARTHIHHRAHTLAGCALRCTYLARPRGTAGCDSWMVQAR